MSLSLWLRIFASGVAALGVYPLANALTGGAAVPWWRGAVVEWLVAGGLAIGASVVIARLLGERLDRWAQRVMGLLLRPAPASFALMLAIGVALLAAIVARVAFAGQPFTSDEMAQQWHARILLSGNLSALTEAHPEFFNTAPVFDRGPRWFSQYPIGGPALVALGMLLGAAWVVNAILTGVSAAAFYLFLRRAVNESFARLAALLFAVSPMVLIMGGSQMNHVPALAFTLVALAALAYWDVPLAADPPRRRYAVVIGVSVGLIATVRPLDALLVAAVVGAFQFWRARHRPSLLWRTLAIQTLAGLIPVAALLWANEATTGAPLRFAYDALNGAAHGLGFHVDPTGEVHTPRRGLVLVSGYLLRLARYLFEWPLPGTLFVVVGAAALRHPTRWDALLALLASAVLLAHGAYWFDGFFAGPRFLFTAVPAFVYFAARAPWDLGASGTPLVRRTLVVLVPLCVAATWSGLGRETAHARVQSYGEQRSKLKTDLEAQVERQSLRHALVFVNEGWRGRLLAQLRVLGVSQFRAERLVSTLDACALQTALDTVRTGTATDRVQRITRAAGALGTARLEPGLPADRAIALVPGTRPSPMCLHEFFRDTAGTMPFPMFLARQRVNRDGRVGGAVVFARDLGARNELLRERFGDRAWYRYQPGRSADDTAAVFVPWTAAR